MIPLKYKISDIESIKSISAIDNIDTNKTNNLRTYITIIKYKTDDEIDTNKLVAIKSKKKFRAKNDKFIDNIDNVITTLINVLKIKMITINPLYVSMDHIVTLLYVMIFIILLIPYFVAVIFYKEPRNAHHPKYILM